MHTKNGCDFFFKGLTWTYTTNKTLNYKTMLNRIKLISLLGFTQHKKKETIIVEELPKPKSIDNKFLR